MCVYVYIYIYIYTHTYTLLLLLIIIIMIIMIIIIIIIYTPTNNNTINDVLRCPKYIHTYQGWRCCASCGAAARSRRQREPVVLNPLLRGILYYSTPREESFMILLPERNPLRFYSQRGILYYSTPRAYD